MVNRFAKLLRTSSRYFPILLAAAILTGHSSPAAAQVSVRGGGKKPQKKKGPPKSRIPRGDAKLKRPKVKPVDPGKRAKAINAARRIDLLIDISLKKHELKPNRSLNDAQFVRRAHLDITGTIPTLGETHGFIRSKDNDKRSKLIDKLLNSEGYVSHHFNFWGNTLRLTDRAANNNNLQGQPYHEWIKKSLRDNTPYDKWVHSMLTADGQIWDNPAVGYLMRNSGMELDAVDQMVRVFLGTRIGCARCHDHPFDRWTQMEFYQMASFMYGARTRRGGRDKKFGGKNPVQRVRKEMTEADPKFNTGGDFNRIMQANLYEVYDQPTRRLRLPHDYAYDDGKPKSVVQSVTLFGDKLKINKNQPPRDVLATWLTGRKNPRFALTIANRLWAKAMGIGIMEPIDDIQDETEPSNKKLMEFLVSEMIRLNFDMKEFQRIIYNTKAWQRQATTKEVDPTQPYYFQGPILRRMTAEQAWDSLLTLAVYNPEGFVRTSFENLGDVIEMDLKNVKGAEVQKRAKEFKEKFGTGALRKADRAHSYKGMTLARASELPLPVPANHFLRQFGQGDRQLIDTASTDGSVSQILTMFNGQITHMMLENGSVIFDNVMKGRNMKNKIQIIFLSILNRFPSPKELDIAEGEIRAAKNAGFGNVIWALVNTKEFLFIQ